MTVKKTGQEPDPNSPDNDPDKSPDNGGGDDPGGQDPQGQSDKKPSNQNQDPGDGGFDDLAAANAEIKKLRGENAKARTTNKDLKSQVDALGGRFSQMEKGLKSLFGDGEDDKLTPEQRLEKVQAQNATLEIENALRDAAWEQGVSKDDFEFFSFLANKELDQLDEGQELSDEKLAEIAQKAKGRSANSSTSTGGDGQGNGNGNGKTPNPADAQDPDVPSPDEFAAMGIGEQSLLYQKLKAKGRQAEYDKLWKASETKRRELKRQRRLF